MTKLGIISDLHLEFYDTMFTVKLLDKINSCEADKIVVAGDIHSSKMSRDYFLSEIDKPLFFILGNHDYYGSDWYDDFTEDNDIIGGALWTNFQNDPMCEYRAMNDIADFRYIKDWSVDRVKNIHGEHRKKIFKSDKEIVVTHFPPSFLSCSPQFKGDILNGYFMNNMEEEILNSNKKLWICGHVHHKHEYMIGDCHVIANPLGYPRENKEDFEIKIVNIA